MTTAEKVFYGIFAIPLAYLIVRAAAIAWYRTKLNYQRNLINGLEEGRHRNGEQAEKAD